MRFGLLACVLALSATQTAHAQANSLSIAVTRIEGPGGVRDESAEIQDGVNIADCAAPGETEITIRVGQSPQRGAGFDLWVALVADCESSETRSGVTQTCFDIGRQITLLGANMDFVLTLDELTVDERNPCTDITSAPGGNYYLHLFDSGLESTTGELQSDWPRGSVAIPVDVAAPTAPEITSGDASGEGALDVTWEADAGDSDVQNYEFELFNLGACGGASGGDAAVATDGGAGDASTPFRRVSDSSVGIRPSDLGLAVGEGALIAVRAVDPAENRSELSAPICITHVPTVGFCELAGECSGTCNVTAPGAEPGRPFGALAGFAAALGILIIHRARTRPRNRRSRA